MCTSGIKLASISNFKCGIVPGLELRVCFVPEMPSGTREKQLGWWYYMGVRVVRWVGHPSGRLHLPKAVSLSALPSPAAAAAAAHTLLACSSYKHMHIYIDQCKYI